MYEKAEILLKENRLSLLALSFEDWIIPLDDTRTIKTIIVTVIEKDVYILQLTEKENLLLTNMDGEKLSSSTKSRKSFSVDSILGRDNHESKVKHFSECIQEMHNGKCYF